MGEKEFQLVRAAALVAAVLVAVALERRAPHAGYRGSWRINAGLWAVNVVVLGVVCGACACSVARWAEQNGLGLWNVVRVPSWLGILGTVVALDLVSYAWHRMNHVIPVLWRAHRLHHSDATFTASTAVRFHPIELVLSLPMRLLAVLLLGASPTGVVVFEAVFTVANWLEHGDIECPIRLEAFLGRVVVTPALHRRHHDQGAERRDSNFGTIFSLWDRLLGTYGRSTSREHFSIGLLGVPVPGRLVDALRLPFA